MDKIRINSRLSIEEKETVLIYSAADKKWYADTVVPKHFNKFKKQGWTQTTEYVYEDGSPAGGVFEASDKGITIRNPNIKRVMSDEQMKNLHKHDEDDEDDED